MLKRKQDISSSDEHVSVHDVLRISGITDEDAIKAIIATGATKQEIQRACDYCFENLHVKSSRQRPIDGRIRNVVDILDYSRDFLD